MRGPSTLVTVGFIQLCSFSLSLPPHDIRAWKHKCAPGRVTVGKSISLIGLGFLNQALGSTSGAPMDILCPFPFCKR